MKLTFKVIKKPGTGYVDLILNSYRLQDLKQQKFVIEAEPSETVRIQYPRTYLQESSKQYGGRLNFADCWYR